MQKQSYLTKSRSFDWTTCRFQKVQLPQMVSPGPHGGWHVLHVWGLEVRFCKISPGICIILSGEVQEPRQTNQECTFVHNDILCRKDRTNIQQQFSLWSLCVTSILVLACPPAVEAYCPYSISQECINMWTLYLLFAQGLLPLPPFPHPPKFFISLHLSGICTPTSRV